MSFACSSSLVRICSIITRRRMFISEKTESARGSVAGNPFGYEILLNHFDKSSCLTVLRKADRVANPSGSRFGVPRLIDALSHLPHVLGVLRCVLIEFFFYAVARYTSCGNCIQVYRSTQTISVASTVCKISIVYCTSA
jgi:hypothetical protein